MKKWFYEKYKNLTFLQGVALTICLSSLISVAATNLPGFFIFSAGTPISSSEINSNFEKIAGKIVLQASLTSSTSINETNFAVLATCSTCYEYKRKISFDSASTSDTNWKTTNDLESDHASYHFPFHYYQVPTTGWYELRFIHSSSLSITNPACLGSNCSVNLHSTTSIMVAESLTNATSNSQSSSWILGGSSSEGRNDTNSDSSFDASFSQPQTIPEIKRVYLKARQILFVKNNAGFNQNSATASYFATFSSADLTIIQL